MGHLSLQLLLLHLVLLCFADYALCGSTSPYVRSEYPSTDIPLDDEAFVLPEGYNSPQQVLRAFLVCIYPWMDCLH